MNKTNKNLIKLTVSAICLALCIVLPFFTGNIPQIGSMLCPIHIPVLLCGFLCGPWYAMGIGIIAPMLRNVLGLPPAFLNGIAMCVELAVYGLVVGFLYRTLPKKTINLYISLILAMIAGRIAWGCMMLIIMGISGKVFTWTAFITGAVVNAIPGIIVHIILIPLVIIGLKKAKIMELLH